MSLRHRNVAAAQEEDEQAPSTTATIIRRVRAFDVYPKAEDEALTQTSSGGSLTLITLCLSLLLFLSELYSFLSPSYSHSITVDTRPSQRIPIIFNISFPHLQCSLTSIDVMDVSGEVQVDASRDIFRTRLSSSGQKIGSAFLDLHTEGGEHRVDRKGEGCLVSATLTVNKVAGNVHIALGSSHGHEGGGKGSQGGKHMHQFLMPEMLHFDASHRILTFAFGPAVPTTTNPLDATDNLIAPPYTSAHFQYFIKGQRSAQHRPRDWRSFSLLSQCLCSSAVCGRSAARLSRHLLCRGVLVLLPLCLADL